jgi:hypothetical protein
MQATSTLRVFNLSLYKLYETRLDDDDISPDYSVDQALARLQEKEVLAGDTPWAAYFRGARIDGKTLLRDLEDEAGEWQVAAEVSAGGGGAAGAIAD